MQYSDFHASFVVEFNMLSEMEVNGEHTTGYLAGEVLNWIPWVLGLIQ